MCVSLRRVKIKVVYQLKVVSNSLQSLIGGITWPRKSLVVSCMKGVRLPSSMLSHVRVAVRALEVLVSWKVSNWKVYITLMGDL